jgi:lactoylglutathione lyase
MTGQQGTALVLFKHADYVMVTVSDMDRSLRFYRDVLGLAVKFESKEWSEFITGQTTIALHGGGKANAAQSSNRKENLAGTCSIGFNVTDLDEAFNKLKSRGAHFVMPPTQREGEGIKLAVCVDPDGLPISFAEEVKREERPLTQSQTD